MLLLDTHVLVWLVEGDARLGVQARETIEQERGLFYSSITAWEMGMLVRVGRMHLSRTAEATLAHVRDVLQVLELATDSDIALDAGLLPRSIHGDPADRIIMASARALDCPLVTADEKILAHAAAGHLRAVDARA